MSNKKGDLIELETERLLIRLLTLSQMKLWVKNISMLETELDCKYDAEPLEGVFLDIIHGQIKIIEEDPKNYMYHSFWVIIRKRDRKIVGSMDFKNIPNSLKEVEIGYGLGKKHEHNGYMTEAINEFCKAAFLNEKIKTIVADTEKGNIASEKVLERCGFKKYKEEETIWWKLENSNAARPHIA